MKDGIDEATEDLALLGENEFQTQLDPVAGVLKRLEPLLELFELALFDRVPAVGLVDRG